MPADIFYEVNPLLISLVLIGVLVVALEIGIRVKNRWVLVGADSIEKADIALVLGGVLTLLALLLGFTYAMSAARYETRKQLVVDEADAIGTTYLRAKTLPEPQSSEIQELLRQYAALRIETTRMTDVTPESIRELDKRTKLLHGLLWSHAATLARENPNPITSIFLVTLNEMIDLHTKRLAAFRNRVPFPIYLVLFVVSAIAMWLVGYYFGSPKPGVQILTTVLAILVALVMWLIMDLDQPLSGAIRTSQQSLIELNQDMNQTSQDATKKLH